MLVGCDMQELKGQAWGNENRSSLPSDKLKMRIGNSIFEACTCVRDQRICFRMKDAEDGEAARSQRDIKGFAGSWCGLGPSARGRLLA